MCFLRGDLKFVLKERKHNELAKPKISIQILYAKPEHPKFIVVMRKREGGRFTSCFFFFFC